MAQKRTKKSSSGRKSKKAPFSPPPEFLVADVALDQMKLHFDRGINAALYDALEMIIILYSIIKAPEWVLEGALRITGERLKKGASIGDGSSGNEKTKYRRQLIHYWRWRAYQRAIDEGTAKIDAFAEASARLKGTYARGSEYAIESSVKIANQLRKQFGDTFVYLPNRSGWLLGTPWLTLAKKAKSETE